MWFEDEADNYREVFTTASTYSAQDIIDAIQRDFGKFNWMVGVANFHDDGSFKDMASEWSSTQTLNRVRRMPIEALPPENRSDVAHLAMSQGFDDPGLLIAFVRDFIYENSNQDDAPMFNSNQPNYSDALAMMYSAYESESSTPSLFCDGMATAMHTVLSELGIESRLVFLYGQTAGWINEHTVLEVFNPASQSWELHDVLTATTYVLQGSTQPQSVERVLFGNLKDLDICRYGSNCQPLGEAGTVMLREQYGAVRYGHSDTFWVNPDRIDVSVRYEAFGGRNLPEFLTGSGRDFKFIFDSWHQD
jgi:hypothetical protein